MCIPQGHCDQCMENCTIQSLVMYGNDITTGSSPTVNSKQQSLSSKQLAIAIWISDEYVRNSEVAIGNEEHSRMQKECKK